jgi:hypothetical protein
MKKGRILMAGLAGALTGVAAWFIPASRRLTPAERERRRRLSIHANGRTGGATITDFHDEIVSYKYYIGGVEYTAFQDVSALARFLPEDPRTLIQRPATLKYLPHNPANSILVCEEWSGLRFQPRATTP